MPSHDSPRTFLITGGAGFVGAALTERLLADGHAVRIIDPGDPWRLNELLPHPKLLRLETTVQTCPDLDEHIRAADFVFHLAAHVGVDTYVQAPADVLAGNLAASSLVLTSCLRLDTPVFLSSSSEVYGNTPLSLREDAPLTIEPPTAPRSSYAISKLTAESHALGLHREGLHVTIGRPFNLYGPKLARPGQGRVISRMLGAVLSDQPVELVDGGAAVRSFCYIDDAVEMLLGIAGRHLGGDPDSPNPCDGAILNLGRHEPVTMRELAELLWAVAGRKPQYIDVEGSAVFGPGFTEIHHRTPDTSKTTELLGIAAATPLHEGLARVVAAHGIEPRRSARLPVASIPMVRPQVTPDSGVYSAFAASFRSGWLSNNGPENRGFEAEMAAFLGVEDVIAVSTGADGLMLAMLGLGLDGGSAILPSFTYIATMNAVVHAGLKPVFCDIDPETWTLAPDALKTLLEQHPDVRVVLPVNAYGVPADIPAIRQLCAEHDVRIVYDNCHGMGSERHGQRIEDGPDMQMFSLHATKILPAVEGGLVYTPHAELRDELRRLRNHGLGGDLHQATPGINGKLDELRAAVGRHSLRELPETLARRRSYGHRFRRSLAHHSGMFSLQAIPHGVVTNFQNFAVRCRVGPDVSLESIIDVFAGHGVQARRYFWPPLHELAMFEGRFNLPTTDWLSAGLVCLPMHSEMDEPTLAQVEAAAAAVAEEFAS